MSKPQTSKADKGNPDDESPGLGLLADAAWIADGDAPEDPEQLRALHESLPRDLRPLDAVEELLVEVR
jgi:hypothetical protein